MRYGMIAMYFANHGIPSIFASMEEHLVVITIYVGIRHFGMRLYWALARWGQCKLGIPVYASTACSHSTLSRSKPRKSSSQNGLER